MGERIKAPTTTKHLAMLTNLAKGDVPPPPIAQLIGFRLQEVDLARTTMVMSASSRHANPMGTLHGGVICDIADAAMGTAMATTLEDDESFTTLDLTTKFLKPVWNAELTATATVTKRTRTLGLVECDVTDEKGSLVAKVWSSCMVLRGAEAQGR
jgi:uncharacterized protein (TIGR00369 family)